MSLRGLLERSPVNLPGKNRAASGSQGQTRPHTQDPRANQPTCKHTRALPASISTRLRPRGHGGGFAALYARLGLATARQRLALAPRLRRRSSYQRWHVNGSISGGGRFTLQVYWLVFSPHCMATCCRKHVLALILGFRFWRVHIQEVSPMFVFAYYASTPLLTVFSPYFST